MLGLGHRNTTFLVEDENLFRNRDLSSTSYSVNLTNYYYKNLIDNQSKYNVSGLEQARIDIDLYNNKKIMLGVKPLFTSNFSIGSDGNNQYLLPDQQNLSYKKFYKTSGDISDYYIGYFSVYNNFKFGLVLYYEFGMQTILNEVFTYPTENSINLASKKLYERQYTSSRINLIYEHNFNSFNKGLFLLSLHQPINLNQKEYELLTNENGNLLIEYDSESNAYVDQMLFKYQYLFTSDKKMSLLINRLNSFKINNPNFNVVRINNSNSEGISSYDVSSLDLDFYLNKKIGMHSRNNKIILGLGANYSKIRFEDILFDEIAVKIKLGLNTIYNSLIINIKYGNRFNNTFDIKGENFIKVSLDLTLGDVYRIK